GGLLLERDSQRPLAYRINYERPRLLLLDDCLRFDTDFLNAQDLGDWWPTARTEDDFQWLLSASSDRHPGAAYLYERGPQRLRKLFELRPELSRHPRARMQSAILRARDDLPLVCYLSLPREIDTGQPLRSRAPAPLVLLVHGGPWVRD